MSEGYIGKHEKRVDDVEAFIRALEMRLKSHPYNEIGIVMCHGTAEKVLEALKNARCDGKG